jgi:hypothetical protein
MMRAADAARHNEIANHPSVYPLIAPIGSGESIDFAPCLDDPERYVLLLDGDAATCFERDGEATWEMHFYCLPGSGKSVLPSLLRMIQHMFDDHDAELIWGKSKSSNRAALLFNRKLGGTSRGARVDPVFGEVEVFTCSRAEWEAHSAK